MELTTKKCSKCGEVKESPCFGMDKKRKGGLCVYCKVCIRAIYLANIDIKKQQQQLYYHRDKVKISGKLKERRKSDPKYRAQRSVSGKKWSDNNKGKKAETGLAYRNTNKESILKRRKINYWANVDESREQANVRIKKAVDTLAPAYLNNIIARRLGIKASQLRLIPATILPGFEANIKAEIQLKRLIKSKTQPNQSHAN
jgi:hypothetical protein